MNCPRCNNELGPQLVGTYSQFPLARFCDKCVRFFEERDARAEDAHDDREGKEARNGS